MKYRYLTALLVLVCCNSPKEKTDHSHEMIKKADSSVQVATVKKFTGVQFASKYDTTCGMPISAGLEDTIVYKSKVYGFCATECKNEFAAL